MRKRILVLTPRFPYPPLSGGKLAIMNVAKALKECDLTLLSLCETREEMELTPNDGVFAEVHKVYLPKLTSYWNALSALPGRTPIQLAYYRSETFRKKFEELAPHHDAVLAHLIRSGQYVTESDQKMPRILLMSDAISFAYQRLAKLPGTSLLWRMLSRVEVGRLADFERTCPKKFDLVWLHSDVDRKFLGLEQQRSVRTFPLGVDLDEFPFNAHVSGNVLAFVGNMSFSLNIDACQYFLKEIFPMVRAKTGVKLRVIGACPPKVRQEVEKHEGVEVTGTVRRIADAVDGVFCGICCVRAGAGIQTKILNYLALGIPCVTSDVGLEGLRAVDGRDVLVYENPQRAVEHIVKLHGDASLRQRMAENGRRYVEREHDWKVIHASIRKNVSELLS